MAFFSEFIMRKPFYLHPQQEVKVWIDETNANRLVLTQTDEFGMVSEIYISPLYADTFISLCQFALVQEGA